MAKQTTEKVTVSHLKSIPVSSTILSEGIVFMTSMFSSVLSELEKTTTTTTINDLKSSQLLEASQKRNYLRHELC